MIPKTARLKTHRSRGTVYLFVLAVSVLVTGIGLSSLLAMRVERRTTDLATASVRARFAASSLLELVLLRINSDAGWRQTYEHNVWEPNETVEGLVFTFKLVDELDGSLSNDVTQEVRLYSKITSAKGSAVRIYSVLLKPVQCVNLLSNPGFEDGTAGWTGSDCTLVPSGDTYRGTSSMLLQNRMVSDSMIYQGGLTGVVENGKPYYVEVWAKSVFATEEITVSLRTDGDVGGTQVVTTSPTTVGDWTLVCGYLTPTWSGALTLARWRASTAPLGGATDFVVDQALMMEAGNLAMQPVSGTWRRDIEL